MEDEIIIIITENSSPEPQVEIFTALEKENVPYAVCVSPVWAKGIHNVGDKEYFMAAPIKDFKPLRKYGFRKINWDTEQQDHRECCTRPMTHDEIEEFKKIQPTKFVKVVNTKDGRVYELRGKSLKEYIRLQQCQTEKEVEKAKEQLYK